MNVAYVYYEEEKGRRAAANLMTKDEARRIAANIVKLPELLGRLGANNHALHCKGMVMGTATT